MQTLSEKAKGKQRAEPIPEDVFNNGGPIPPRQLMVRFTEGVQDLVLQVAENDSVRDVKAKVCMFLARLYSQPACISHFPHLQLSDPRRAPQTPPPSLAPHPRRTAPRRRDANIILAWYARRAPAARRDKSQSQRQIRPVHIAYRAAHPHQQLVSLGSRRAMASLLRRRSTIRRRGRG
jgi:hypothetical protein